MRLFTIGGHLQEDADAVIWLGNFLNFGKVVANKRWLQLAVQL